jgi:DNA polymerase III delta subunit
MIIILDSTDKDELLKHVALMRKNLQGVEYEKIEEASMGTIMELAGGASLFGEKFLYNLPLDEKLGELSDYLIENHQSLKNSQHTLMLHGFCKPTQGKKLADIFDNYTKISSKESFQKRSSEGFVLAELIIRKDKKNAWVLYSKLRQKDISTRELVPQIWWQLKTCLQIIEGVTKDVKPYSLSKTQVMLRGLDPVEVKSRIESFIDKFSAQPSDKDLDRHFESWLLSL